MTQELTPRERATVARVGIHDPEVVSPAATARANGWTTGTRLHGGPVRDRHGHDIEQAKDIIITAVGLERVLAIPASGDGAEHTIGFDTREWTAVRSESSNSGEVGRG